jgi:small ligand-binding sensory domain FIST
MASASEAFEKFETWRKSKTSLKVTVIVGGKPTDVLMGRIFGVDPDAGQIGVSNPLVMHSAVAFDVEDAEFSVESSRLVATRNESDWIIFEEISELLPMWPFPVR